MAITAIQPEYAIPNSKWASNTQQQQVCVPLLCWLRFAKSTAADQCRPPNTSLANTHTYSCSLVRLLCLTPAVGPFRLLHSKCTNAMHYRRPQEHTIYEVAFSLRTKNRRRENFCYCCCCRIRRRHRRRSVAAPAAAALRRTVNLCEYVPTRVRNWNPFAFDTKLVRVAQYKLTILTYLSCTHQKFYSLRVCLTVKHPCAHERPPPPKSASYSTTIIATR